MARTTVVRHRREVLLGTQGNITIRVIVEDALITTLEIADIVALSEPTRESATLLEDLAAAAKAIAPHVLVALQRTEPLLGQVFGAPDE